MSGKNIITLASLLALGACGHYAPPETFEAKMARYQVKQGSDSTIPQIEPVGFRTQNSRAPASVSSETNEEVGFSNKKLYFITLYRQYNQMAMFSSFEPRKINQCPSFHSALVDHSEKPVAQTKWTPNYDTSKLSDDSYTRYHPELYLPVSQNSATPRVIDVMKNNSDPSFVQTAVNNHVDKMYAELAELCEYGSSDNYYAFENLHTEIKKRNVASPGTNGMRILLKTTLFSNKAVIESLKRYSKPAGRAPASAVKAMDFDNEVMKRLGVTWAKGYYQALKDGQ